MIQYMPFTYIAESTAERLTRVLGPLAVWQPLESMTPPHMQKMFNDGRLCPLKPGGIDPVQLKSAARAFNQWGALHQHKSGDLSTLVRTGPSGAGDDSIQQIRAQIRRGGQSPASAADERLFQAALFLCLAHHYDEQQDALARQLGSVRHLENSFGRIMGDVNLDAGIAPPVSSAGDRPADPGAYMTDRRLQAWSRLAAAQQAPEDVYLTSSQAVWDYLEALFPDAWRVAAPSAPAAVWKPEDAQSVWHDLLAQDRLALRKAEDGSGWPVEGGGRLTLAVLVGVSPNAFRARLEQAGDPAAPGHGAGRDVARTLIGYLPA